MRLTRDPAFVQDSLELSCHDARYMIMTSSEEWLHLKLHAVGGTWLPVFAFWFSAPRPGILHQVLCAKT